MQDIRTIFKNRGLSMNETDLQMCMNGYDFDAIQRQDINVNMWNSRRGKEQPLPDK